MKKKICIALSFVLCAIAAAQKSAQFAVEQIEQTKNDLSYILANTEGPDSAKRRQLRHSLYTQYSEMEKTSFSERLDDVKIVYYDKTEQGWILNIKGDIVKDCSVADFFITLPYNVFSGKKFRTVEKMSARQIADYEETVDTADKDLNNPQNTLYATVDFSLQKWNEASQYRFKPNKLSIYFVKDEQTLLLLETEELAQYVHTFTVYPQIEVRNETQLESDKKRNASILEAEEKQNSDPSPKKKKSRLVQKGRRTFSFNLDSRKNHPTPDGFKFRNIKLSTVTGELTFGLGQFLFGGLSVGYDLDSINSNSIYEFGGSFGANVRVTSFLRPFLQAGAGITTGNKLFSKLGFGMDLTLKNFLITGSYSYQLRYKWKSILDNGVTIPSEHKHYHTFSLGLGVSW